MLDVTFSPLVGGHPNGLVMRITTLYDTGSDLVTIYTRDLEHLDPNNHFPQALGELIPILTVAGAIHRQAAIGAARLVNFNGQDYLGGWFQEDFCIQPDIPLLDMNGEEVVDANERRICVDERLSGAVFRSLFFKGSGERDSRLVISTIKSQLQPNLPA